MNLNQVTIPTIDLEKSIAFYSKLGLELIVHSTNNYARFQCPTGSSTFSIQLVDELTENNLTKVYFETKALDNKVSELILMGMEFESLPKDKPWKWREAHLKDPDNNQIILYFAGENRLNPPWKIKT